MQSAWESESRKPYRRDVTDIEFINLVRASLGKDPLPSSGGKQGRPLSETERRALSRSALQHVAQRPVCRATR